MDKRRVPETVEVYEAGQSLKCLAKSRKLYQEAAKIVAEGRGIFRDHRRKLVLFPLTRIEPSNSQRSQCALTAADAVALAGVTRLSAKQHERIAGWELAQRGRL